MIAPCDASSSEATDVTVPDTEKLQGPKPLSSIGRDITRQYFEQTNPIGLAQDHPTIALNSEQMRKTLRVVAVESARASYAMTEDLMERASKLNFGGNPNQPGPSPSRLFPDSSYPGSDVDDISEGRTERQVKITSEALRSENYSNNIGYIYERTLGPRVRSSGVRSLTEEC